MGKAMCDICCRPKAQHVGRDLQCPETVYYRPMPAALTKAAPPVEADLREAVARIIDPVAWKHFAQQIAYRDDSPSDDAKHMRQIMADKIVAPSLEKADAILALQQSRSTPVAADHIDRATLSAKLDELIVAASRQWGAGSTEHNLIRDVSDVVSRVPAALATPAPVDAGGTLGAAAFLCARLREFESDLKDDEVASQYLGHVQPALNRLESLISGGSA